MEHIVPGYSRGRVNRAGWALARTDSRAPEVREDLRVLNNWRAAHSFPLNELHHRLRTLAAPIGSDTIISQRLKTTPSTLAKLRRFPRMQLARMQDMGGCRAALDTVAQVRELHEVHRRAGWEHRLVRDVDYIDRPKPSGYRGVHLVYRYRGDGNSPFNGILIEVQLRTKLQHAWATAVETAGAFLQRALKSSEGEAEWLHFFALASSALALKEGCPTVPDTPANRGELHGQLREYAARLNVVERLRQYGGLIRNVSTLTRIGAYYFLLERRPAEAMTLIIPYEKDEMNQATEDYMEAEEKGRDAVLVSADSIDDLRRAYPNYWLDARIFLAEMAEIL